MAIRVPSRSDSPKRRGAAGAGPPRRGAARAPHPADLDNVEDAEPDPEQNDAQPKEFLQAERNPGAEHIAEPHSVTNDHPDNDGEEDETDEAVEAEGGVDQLCETDGGGGPN